MDFLQNTIGDRKHIQDMGSLSKCQRRRDGVSDLAPYVSPVPHEYRSISPEIGNGRENR